MNYVPVKRLHGGRAGVPEPDAAVLVAGDDELLVGAARVRRRALHAARHRPLARAEAPAAVGRLGGIRFMTFTEFPYS